jgi:glutaredoxin
MNQNVTVYTSALCPVCGMVKTFLDSLDITYKEVAVDLNPVERIKLVGKTKKLTVPQTNINGKWISGFNPEKMLDTLNSGLGNNGM